MYGQKGHTYHLADENFISIKQLVKRISDKLGVNYKKNIIENTNDRLGKDYIYKLDASKIAKELKWSPKVDLDTGLNNSIKLLSFSINISSPRKFDWKIIYFVNCMQMVIHCKSRNCIRCRWVFLRVFKYSCFNISVNFRCCYV